MDETQAESGTEPASERVKVRRSADRGRYDLADVLQILDAGLIAHVGVSTADGPLVLPMAYGHDGESVSTFMARSPIICSAQAKDKRSA